jgi:hypothetical protein
VATVNKNMIECKEQLGDLEGAFASARESHRIYSKLGASYADEALETSATVQRLNLECIK